MSKLTDLRAAFEAKLEAWKRLAAAPRGGGSREEDAYDRACYVLDDLLTDDTIAALIAVAEAVDKGKLTAARHSLYPLVKEATDE